MAKNGINLLKTEINTRSKFFNRKNNPLFIARNHLVDRAIKRAVSGDMGFIDKLLEILSKPYEYQDRVEKL